MCTYTIITPIYTPFPVAPVSITTSVSLDARELDTRMISQGSICKLLQICGNAFMMRILQFCE